MSPDLTFPELKLPDLKFPDLTCDDIFRLETKRLWLRWPRATDAAALAAFAGLSEVARMTANIPHPYPPREADRFILMSRAENAAGAALHLALAQKTATRPVIGLVSAVMTETGEAEIGYALAPQAWGKGFATEAVKTVIDAVFSLTETPRICANSRLGNFASRRVLEKAGFTYIDTGLDVLPARGGLHSCDRFCLKRADWRRDGLGRRMPAMAQQMAQQGRSPAETMAAEAAAKALGELL
ncbi:MAG: GNAT family N-acetyltransferase [Methylovirgula sp.]